MANFMQKERVEVQGSGAYGAENLSKDLFGLMSAVSGTVKSVDKSMVSESKDIGEALARDSILEMVRKKNAYDQQIAENPNDFDYSSAKSDMDVFVAEKLSQVKDRVGSDSVAYKAFEDGFLMNGTKYTEEYKTDLFQKYQTVERKKGVESEMQVVNETVNALGSEGVASSYKRFKQLNMTDEQSSKYFTDTFYGKFQQAEFDPKKLYDGATINRQREIAEFNKYYGSIATMKSDGSIEGKHGFLQQDDVGRIKASWDAKTKIEKKSGEGNILLAVMSDRAKNELSSMNPSGNPEDDFKKMDSLNDYVKKTVDPTTITNEQAKTIAKFENDINEKKIEFSDVYNVVKDNALVSEVMQTGFYTQKDGTVKKVNKEHLVSVTNGLYNKSIDAILSSNSAEEIDTNVQMLKNKMSQTGIPSARVTALTKSITGGMLSTPEDLSKNIEAYQKLNLVGMDIQVNDPMLKKENLEGLQRVIKSEYKTENDKKIAIKNFYGQTVAKDRVTKTPQSKEYTEEINKIFKDSSSYSEFMSGGGVFGGDILKVDAWNTFSGNIVGGERGTSKLLGQFMAHVNYDGTAQDFMQKIVKPTNEDMGIFATGNYVLPLVRVSGNGSIERQEVSMTRVIKHLEEKYKGSTFKPDELAFQYDIDYQTNALQLSIRRRTNGIVQEPIGTPLTVTDMYNINAKYKNEKEVARAKAIKQDMYTDGQPD